MFFMSLHFHLRTWFVGTFVIVTLTAIVYLAVKQRSSREELKAEQARNASSTAAFIKRVGDLEIGLADLTNQSLQLVELLKAEQSQSGAFQNEIKKIADTVGTLDKLRKTDPRLLQKYSKVYFLNEHYAPTDLVSIPIGYASSADKLDLKIHSGVWPHLDQMLTYASSSGNHIKIVSAYRSFGTQATLKSNYTVIYGSGANKFSADQGYSEHQLGTTLDFSTAVLGNNFSKIDMTNEYKWLENNAHFFGFTLSYPKGNGYYEYEPWHWRYVGVELASRLYKDGKHFYDLEQAEIDKYLISIFD